MVYINKLSSILDRAKLRTWFSPPRVPMISIVKCMIFSFGAVGSCLQLIDSLLNLKTMANFPMPDRMPADMVHEFVRRACFDGAVATISGFVLGVSLMGLWSEFIRQRRRVA